MKNNSSNTSFQSLNRSQMKTLKGGGVPSPFGFCCGPRPQSFWLEDYPFLAERYNCLTVSCESAD